MKKGIFILALFIAYQVNAQVLTLDACQDSALANYPLIHQFGLIEKSKELTVSNANKAWLPQFDITIIGGIIDGFPSFAPPGEDPGSSTETQLITLAQLNQVIWDGGMTKASKKIISANTEIEKAEMEVNLYKLKERVNNLYFGILLIDEQIAQLDLLNETLIRNQKRIQNAIENGTAFQSDEDEIKVEIINVGQKQDELRYNRQAYVQVLSLMIGEQIYEEAIFTRPEISLKTQELGVHRPELVKFQNQKSLINAQAKLNKATLIPKFGLMGFGVFFYPGVEFGTSTMNNLLVAGLSLSWQLSPLYKNGNNKKLTQISLQRIQNQEETFLFNTNLELNQTNVELEKYRKLLAQDREILALKKSISEAYVVRQENGVATMSQLLDKVNDENLAKQQMIMHEIQYLLKKYQYLYKSGN